MKETRFHRALRFQIPGSWTEESDAAGDRVCYSPAPDSGTLHIHLATFRKLGGKLPEEYTFALGESSAPVETLANGQLLRHETVSDEKDGTTVRRHRWQLARVCSPDCVRAATFTYTLQAAAESGLIAQQELRLIDAEIRNAVLAEPAPDDLARELD